MQKTLIGSLLLAVGMLATQVGSAQAPAGAPAGSTGLCNDGTYYSGATKSGACRGHKGVKQWWGAASAKSSKGAESKPTPAPAPAAAKPAPAPSPAASTPKSSATTPAPGGGAGKVWVNTASNVYHCPGSQYYGKTKAGTYMSEADAKGKGAHPAEGKPCK
jgi:hypothetical protein